MEKPVTRSEARRNQSAPVVAKPPFECIALLLQGGGALGAYQAGVYQALADSNLQPNWVAGISIGAINAAIIAGNPAHLRVEKLLAFWQGITSGISSAWPELRVQGNETPSLVTDKIHELFDQFSAFQALILGAPGFFSPRVPPPWFVPAGGPQSTSFYDTAGLVTTLEGLVDFDRINSRAMRLSVGAVNLLTGNFVYFDTETDRITAKHILASCALPPGFPAIEIDGQQYWDGGLVCNTPLQWVVDQEPRQDMLAFQVDLWSARGLHPVDLTEVAVRLKEIQFSSRTRACTDQLRHLQLIRSLTATILPELSDEVRQGDAAKALAQFAESKVYNVVQLIYRSKHYEGNTKDYEFSKRSMKDHWSAGFNDGVRALTHREIFLRPSNDVGFQAFDFNDRDNVTGDPQHRSRTIRDD